VPANGWSERPPNDLGNSFSFFFVRVVFFFLAFSFFFF
jgi:hypothetical protein